MGSKIDVVRCLSSLDSSIENLAKLSGEVLQLTKKAKSKTARYSIPESHRKLIVDIHLSSVSAMNHVVELKRRIEGLDDC